MKSLFAFIPRPILIIGIVIFALLYVYPFYGAEYRIAMLGMFLCFAILAVSVDLIWGFAGILSLGQAVYFGVGAYMVALSLKLDYAAHNPTRYGSGIPDFMEWNGLEEVPGFMQPLQNIYFAIAMALLIPLLMAFIFGFFTFKRHIYGVYCAVITLAESLILQEAIIEWQPYTGGFNGITDYGSYDSHGFYWLILSVTLLTLLFARLLTFSRFGTILRSIRDNEVRAEFMGFEVANYKILVFCVSAVMAGIAGAMYAAWMGIVSFLDAGPMLSVESVIWVAVGGRGTIIGPFIGTLLVKGAEFFLSEKLAWIWQLFMGALFILVVMVVPDGIVGTIAKQVTGKQTAKIPLRASWTELRRMIGGGMVFLVGLGGSQSRDDKK